MRNLKTGKNENLPGDLDGVLTAAEKLAHERFGHATFSSRCHMCIRVRGISRHPDVRSRKLPNLAYVSVRNSLRGSEVKILVGVGPRGERHLLEQPTGKGQQTRCGNTPVLAIMKHVCASLYVGAAGRLVPTGVQQWYRGQRTVVPNRACEHFVNDVTTLVKMKQLEIFVNHPVTRWAVRHGE